ncbi:MAG: hypothetical protein ACP5RD_09080, partial [bacterium]
KQNPNDPKIQKALIDAYKDSEQFLNTVKNHAYNLNDLRNNIKGQSLIELDLRENISEIRNDYAKLNNLIKSNNLDQLVNKLSESMPNLNESNLNSNTKTQEQPNKTQDQSNTTTQGEETTDKFKEITSTSILKKLMQDKTFKYILFIAGVAGLTYYVYAIAKKMHP